ncbi:type VI secretion system protein TssL, short form [Photorhabdus sp. APURE]|uniref:type VI secretion system protein TssL, short form n=1 Tax=Photorhabdus aballayi TaxID=2991723 RepID=UPI00223E47F8|nr:type VI secretion system protein TssL, short form [Photorhabdus aballayi]MCW7549292.1 type VI secretion system protein TssL, short form [Photorhabdus aballayi]
MNQSHLLTEKSTLDIDALLQDSYLLVIELCRGVRVVKQWKMVWQRCTAEIERTQQVLRDAGVDESAINHISYAQCALLDEIILEWAPDEGYAAWQTTSLQGHFFDTAEAGDKLYERIRAVLDESTPDQAVLICFHRVLLLGFQGACQKDIREQLIIRLSQQIVHLVDAQSSSVLVMSRLGSPWLRSTGVRLSMMIVGLSGVWWGLGQYLSTLFLGLGR